MKKILCAALMAILLSGMLLNCRSASKQVDEAPPNDRQPPLAEPAPAQEKGDNAPAQPAAPKEPVGQNAPQQAPADKQDKDINNLLKEFKQGGDIQQQREKVEAATALRLAQDHYRNRNYEQAIIEADRAVKFDPENVSAKILLQELKVLLGKATPQDLPAQVKRFYYEDDAQRQKQITEVQNAFSRGRTAYNTGNYDQAERDFRYILEVAKYLPFSIDLEKISADSKAMLDKTKGAKKERELHDKILEQKLVEDESQRKEVMRKIEEKKQLQLLFEQAQIAFEKGEYEKAVELCDKILYVNPNITAAREMSTVAQKLKHNKRHDENLTEYIHQWKETFRIIDMKSIIPDDMNIVHFPDRRVWEEDIAKRKPVSLRAEEEEHISSEDREAAQKLKSLRVPNINATAQPLSEIVNFLREVAGLNFHIRDGVDQNTEITINLKDMTVENVLKNILGQNNLTFYIENGIVFIATADQAKSRVKWDIYKIADLTIGIPDFPGIDLAMATFKTPLEPIAMANPAAEPAFDADTIKGLIENAIAKGSWEGDNSIEAVGGVLVVKHTPEVHDKIKNFLRQLREQSTIMVHIESRFMMVEQSFLEDIGIDFRELDSASIPQAAVAGQSVQGITNLDDINVQFNDFPFNATTPGIASVFGTHILRPMGARVENLLSTDLNVTRFYQTQLSPTGGTQLQYSLLDDISLEAILRMTKKKRRSHIVAAPSVTLYNGQRGNMLIVDQLAYIKDIDPQIAGTVIVYDPIIDVINQGVSLDVKPVVSADKRFVTLELRPSTARLDPPPPNINSFLTPFGIIELPNLLLQRIRTTVIVPDRGTLLVGGLLNYFEVDEISSIPFWKNIPILNILGSAKVKGKSILQHLVLLRVRIVIPAEEEKKTF